MRKSIYILIFLGAGFLVTVLVLLSKLQKMAPKKVQDSSPSLVANETQEPVSQVDYKASFAIYTNGTFRIFTSSMYHYLDGDVFITSESPNTIHIKKQGTTWSYFFGTLPFEISKDCLKTGTGQTFCTNANSSLKFYLNGTKEENVLNKEIKEGDKLLVTYGPKSDPQVVSQISEVPEP